MVQKKSLAIVALAALAVAGTTHAAINYGNFSAPGYNYIGVTEQAAAPDVEPLFGAPSILNNSLHFTPVNFTASSTNGGADLTNGTLNYGIDAKPGSTIDRIAIQEFGDFFLFGNGTPGATASVIAAPVFVTVNEINGDAVTPFTLPFNLSFAPASQFSLPANDNLESGNYSGLLVADLTAALAGLGLQGQVTGAEVNLNNTLGAVSQPGTGALIQKKVFTITPLSPGQPVPGPVIPEPSTLALLSLALPAVLRRRR